MAQNEWFPGGPAAFVVLFSLSFFFVNTEPYTTNYTLPTLVFPERVRASFSGISAAAGKVNEQPH